MFRVTHSLESNEVDHEEFPGSRVGMGADPTPRPLPDGCARISGFSLTASVRILPHLRVEQADRRPDRERRLRLIGAAISRRSRDRKYSSSPSCRHRDWIPTLIALSRQSARRIAGRAENVAGRPSSIPSTATNDSMMASSGADKIHCDTGSGRVAEAAFVDQTEQERYATG